METMKSNRSSESIMYEEEFEEVDPTTGERKTAKKLVFGVARAWHPTSHAKEDAEEAGIVKARKRKRTKKSKETDPWKVEVDSDDDDDAENGGNDRDNS